MRLSTVLAFLPLLAAPVPAAPTGSTPSTSGPMVFAHYMLITRPPNGDYTNDMNMAKAAGIDAFAVNYGGIGVDYRVQDGYLDDFYGAAQKAGMKAFLSIDTTSTPALDAAQVARLIERYVAHPAQLHVDGRPFVSSFETRAPTWDWRSDVLARLSRPCTFMGGTLSDSPDAAYGGAVGAGPFTWLHNRMSGPELVAFDRAMSAAKGSRRWMTAVAPWFFKRFDAASNWAQAADEAIMVDRWKALLALSPRPDFVELTTWNDWGESSYLGPADAADACPACYWSKLDHSGFLRIAKPFVRAFKAGADHVTVDAAEEEALLFYRLQPAATNDDGAGSGLALPQDAGALKDRVYAVGMFARPATVTVTSGGKAVSLAMPAGINVWGVPWTLGAQAVAATRDGRAVGRAKAGGPDVSGTVTRYNGNVVII